MGACAKEFLQRFWHGKRFRKIQEGQETICRLLKHVPLDAFYNVNQPPLFGG